jgi:hypothetical protein
MAVSHRGTIKISESKPRAEQGLNVEGFVSDGVTESKGGDDLMDLQLRSGSRQPRPTGAFLYPARLGHDVAKPESVATWKL